jgi:hypothetical protein
VYALACLCYYVSILNIATRAAVHNLDFLQLSTDGHAPFHNLPQPAALIQIVNLAQRPSRPTDGETSRTLVTDALWAMVESCWAQDASIRPTAAGVVSQLAVIGPAAVAAASPKGSGSEVQSTIGGRLNVHPSGSRVFDARKARKCPIMSLVCELMLFDGQCARRFSPSWR